MVNAVETVVGGVTGAAFGSILDGICVVLQNHTEFTTSHKNVKTTLELLLPLIQDIEGKNNTLLLQDGELKDLKEELEAGVKRVQELSEGGSLWNYCTRPLYNMELDGMDKSLKRLLRILQVQGVRDVKQALVQVKEVSDHVKEGLVQVKDCKTDVDKISNQLDQVASYGEENLNLTKMLLDRVERSNGPSNVVQIREEVASLVEEEALGSALITMGESLDEALSKPNPHFERLGEVKRRVLEWRRKREEWRRKHEESMRKREEWMRENELMRKREEFERERGFELEENFDEAWPIMAFDEVKGLRIKVEEGTELIRKCSNVGWADHNMAKYAKKLDDLAKFLEASVQQRLKRTNSTMPKGSDTQNSRVYFCSSPSSMVIAYQPIITV